ncbi:MULTISPECIES: helix-turn-helix domain-containing protein [unclassified Streptomyces]|uniref:helix-turn-helix domain-containing protein n=1 Tax=unclassified Streptomyces TaxID=2593676 RepID=UPI002E186AA9
MAIPESGPAASEVAKNIQLVRKARQLKQSDVSKRLKAAGRPMLPTVVSKVERGERRIDVDDLVAFGRALGVPPALLLYPLGSEAEVEILPGQTVSTWAAYRWFVGEAGFPGDPGTPHGETDQETGLAEWYEDNWKEGAAPVALWREHAARLADWYAVPSRVRRLRLSEEDERQQRARDWERAEEALEQVRDTMRMSGLTPPPLPDELADGQ